MTPGHPLLYILISVLCIVLTAHPTPPNSPLNSFFLLSLAEKAFMLQHQLTDDQRAISSPSMKAIPPGQSQGALPYPKVAVSPSRARIGLSHFSVSSMLLSYGHILDAQRKFWKQSAGGKAVDGRLGASHGRSPTGTPGGPT